MEIHFSVIGTGLCPGCKQINSCEIRKNLSDAASYIRDAGGYGMEMVIYECPLFTASEEEVEPQLNS